MTLIISTAIAIVAYFLKNEFFDPRRSFNQIRWQVDSQLTFYANRLCNTGMMNDDVRGSMRRLACELPVRYKQIPLANQLSRCRIFPSGRDIQEIASELIFLSNNDGTPDNQSSMTKIREKLKLVRRKKGRASIKK